MEIDWNSMYAAYELGILEQSETEELIAIGPGYTKMCHRCHTRKSVKEFGLSLTIPAGFKDYCKECTKKMDNSPKSKVVRRAAINRRNSRKKQLATSLTTQEWELILEKYDYCCAYCGQHTTVVGPLQQEHVVPSSRGGGYTALNIVPACRTCNVRKNAKTPDEAGLILKRIKLTQIEMEL